MRGVIADNFRFSRQLVPTTRSNILWTDTFGIPHEHIFYSRNSSFLPDLKRKTNGRGVDVVLNSLSGDLLHASWHADVDGVEGIAPAASPLVTNTANNFRIEDSFKSRTTIGKPL